MTVIFEFLKLDKSAVETDCVIEGFVPIIIFFMISFLIATWTAFRKKLSLPNPQKLEQFKLKWQNFDNINNATEAMLKVSEKNAKMRLNNNNDNTEDKSDSIDAFSFLKKRQEIFISRVQDRLSADSCLRFRHDMDFNAGLRGIFGIILCILPGLVRVISGKKFFMFDGSFVITSIINHLLLYLFFSSFVQYEVFQTDFLDLYLFWMQDITAILQFPSNIDNNNKQNKLKSLKLLKISNENKGNESDEDKDKVTSNYITLPEAKSASDSYSK